MNSLDYTFSDLISGYVINCNCTEKVIELNTSDGRPYRAQLTDNT